MSNLEPNELSERELDILKLVATGASNKEIAQKLYISSNTVKVHLRNIFTKINVTSRTEAAMYAVRTGLVEGQAIQPIVEETNGILSEEISSQENATPEISTTSKRYRWILAVIVVIFVGLFPLTISRILDNTNTSNPTPTFLPLQDTPTPIPRWEVLSPVPVARSNLAVVSYDNKLYAIGGVNGQEVFDRFDLFDPQANAWSSLSAKPIPVFDIQGAVINGLIYMPGGRTDVADMQPIKDLEIFDTTSNSWKVGAPLPIPLSGYSMTAFEGKLFVFGGWNGEDYLSDVFSYDPAIDTWQKCTGMPTARAYSGAVEAGGKIYVIGGSNKGNPINNNEIYTPSRDLEGGNPWESGFPLPENHLKVQATSIADTIYVFGSGGPNANKVGLIYFPQTDTWQSLEPSPIPLGDDFGLASIGTNLFFIGGTDGAVFSDQNLTYQAIITLSIPIIIR